MADHIEVKVIDHATTLEICGMHYHKDVFSEWGINGMPIGTLFELVSRDGGMVSIKRHDGEPIPIIKAEMVFDVNDQTLDGLEKLLSEYLTPNVISQLNQEHIDKLTAEGVFDKEVN